MMMSERTMSAIWRKDIVYKYEIERGNRAYSIKKYCFCKFLDFFRESAIIERYIFFCMSIKLFLSLAILISISSLLLFSSTVKANDAQDITKPGFKINLSAIDPVNSSPGSIYQWQDAAIMLLNSIATLLLFLVPIIAGVSFIIAGYYYILSSGDSEKANQAKTIIKWNLVAIAVAIFSYSIVYLVATLLDGSIT